MSQNCTILILPEDSLKYVYKHLTLTINTHMPIEYVLVMVIVMLRPKKRLVYFD